MAVPGRSPSGFLSRSGLARTALAVLALCAFAGSALAALWYDPKSDEWFWRVKVWDDDEGRLGFKDVPVDGISLFLKRSPPRIEAGTETEAAAPASIPADIRNAVYQIDTSAFKVESGEPLAFKRMKRTGWRLFVPDRSGRVVVTTYGSNRFGSPLDTALGVYKRNADGTGALIAKNDDIAAAGGYGRASFVQFDAVKGAKYAIQYGDAGQQGGDMVISLFTFGTGGGLTVQPLSPAGGYDYSCARQSGQSGSCQPAAYALYNATASTLTVTASATGLGSGAAFPKPFTLAPGAAAVKTITFGPAFGVSGAATTGRFVFSGASAGKVVARTLVPARVAIHDGGGATPDLRIAAQAQTVAVQQGTVTPQIIKVTNAGSTAARGCYVKPGLDESMIQTAWAGYDASTGLVSTAPYAPFDIAPGKTASIVVAMRSLRDRLADAAYQRPYEIACASAPSFPPAAAPDLTNVLDFTASVSHFADVSLVSATPAPGILSVAPNGTVMTATFRNDGKAAVSLTAKAVERSIHEFGGPKRYKVSVCLATTTDAKCIASSAASIDLSIQAGKSAAVKVGVKPPADDPGFDPKLIGVALTLSQPYSPSFPIQIPVAGLTKALRLK